MRSLWVLFLFVFGSTSLLASENRTITLAYSDIESYPFQMGNGSEVATPPGLSIDVIEKAANDLNIKIKYVRLPGKRVLHYIKNNQVDGGFLFSYNSQRAQYADYPLDGLQADARLRIATLDYFFYKLADQKVRWDGSSFQSTKNAPVGAHNGFSVVKQLEQKQIDTFEVLSTEQLFQMLLKKRVSAIAIQSSTANSYIKMHQIKNVEKMEPPISTKDYYLVFSHQFTQQNPELTEKIWQTIGVIRDDVFAQEMVKYMAKTH